MEQKLSPFACKNCGSTDFAIDSVTIGYHDERDVVCRNCDSYQGELVIR